MRRWCQFSSQSSLWKVCFSLWSEIIPWCALLCACCSLSRVFGKIQALRFLEYLFDNFPPILFVLILISVCQMLYLFWSPKFVFVFKLLFGGKTSLIFFLIVLLNICFSFHFFTLAPKHSFFSNWSLFRLFYSYSVDVVSSHIPQNVNYSFSFLKEVSFLFILVPWDSLNPSLPPAPVCI